MKKVIRLFQKKLLGFFYKDNSQEMFEIINDEFAQVIDDYKLSEDEVIRICTHLSGQITRARLIEMSSANNKHFFARNVLIKPVMKREIFKRAKVVIPQLEGNILSMGIIFKDGLS